MKTRKYDGSRGFINDGGNIQGVVDCCKGFAYYSFTELVSWKKHDLSRYDCLGGRDGPNRAVHNIDMSARIFVIAQGGG